MHNSARFFSKTLRYNREWKAWALIDKEDSTMWPMCVRSRFFSRTKSAEYMFDRYEWLFDWYDTVKAKERRNKSQDDAASAEAFATCCDDGSQWETAAYRSSMGSD